MIDLSKLEEYWSLSCATHNDIVYQFSKKTREELQALYKEAIENNQNPPWIPSIKEKELQYTVYSYIYKDEELGIIVSNNEFNVFRSPNCTIGCCGYFLFRENKLITELSEELIISAISQDNIDMENY